MSKELIRIFRIWGAAENKCFIKYQWKIASFNFWNVLFYEHFANFEKVLKFFPIFPQKFNDKILKN